MKSEDRELIKGMTISLLSEACGNDYLDEVVDTIIDDVIADVEASSGYSEDGEFSYDDVRIAIGRALQSRLVVMRGGI